MFDPKPWAPLPSSEIADPAQMAALTDMDQDDEKENQAEKQSKQENLEEAGMGLKTPPTQDRSRLRQAGDPARHNVR